MISCVSVRVLLCVSVVSASCVHIWFVSCPRQMWLSVNSCPGVFMWLSMIYLCIYSPVCSLWFRLVYSLLPVFPVLPCLALSALKTIIWVYVLVCVSLFLPAVCTVTVSLIAYIISIQTPLQLTCYKTTSIMYFTSYFTCYWLSLISLSSVNTMKVYEKDIVPSIMRSPKPKDTNKPSHELLLSLLPVYSSSQRVIIIINGVLHLSLLTQEQFR